MLRKSNISETNENVKLHMTASYSRDNGKGIVKKTFNLVISNLLISSFLLSGFQAESNLEILMANGLLN